MSVPTPGEVMIFGSVDSARALAHHAMDRLNRVIDGFNAATSPLSDEELASIERILLARVRLKAIIDDYNALLEGLA